MSMGEIEFNWPQSSTTILDFCFHRNRKLSNVGITKGSSREGRSERANGKMYNLIGTAPCIFPNVILRRIGGGLLCNAMCKIVAAIPKFLNFACEVRRKCDGICHVHVHTLSLSFTILTFLLLLSAVNQLN